MRKNVMSKVYSQGFTDLIGHDNKGPGKKEKNVVYVYIGAGIRE
jgi:hypothetical protein